MKTFYFAVALLTACLSATYAQVTNTATLDTSDVNRRGKVTVSGYIDLYYGYDFSRPADGNRPYFVSSARHNELNVNLAFIDIKYSSANVRARFVPGFGTYMNANYAPEPATLRNLVEANVGVRLSRTKQIWLDAGVLGSPYTNESAISKDHLMYTRSFAPEYVPYYLSGVKLTLPLSQRVTAYLYGLNGWQQIQDVNAGKALGTQLEIRPNDKVLLNWNTYIGDERSAARPNFRTRYFSDIYVIYNSGRRFDATACIYGGIQDRRDTLNGGRTVADRWWQVNIIGRYKLTERTSLSGRLEYFNDPRNVQITAINERVGRNSNPFQFRSSSASLCLNVKVTDNVLARFESRTFFSDLDVFRTANGAPAQSSQLLIGSLAAWF